MLEQRVDMQPHIFDMFTSAKRTGTKGEKSFGLGLSIVKQFVIAHKGNVWVESETVKGATFVVELPWQ
jgi:two-component system sensor histidine kinase VicK